MAGGLTIVRAGVLAGGGALACGEGARGVAFVLSGFMDSGVVFFSGLAAASVTGFTFFSVRLGVMAAGLLVTFCPVDKGDTGLDCGFFTRALALG